MRSPRRRAWHSSLRWTSALENREGPFLVDATRWRTRRAVMPPNICSSSSRSRSSRSAYCCARLVVDRVPTKAAQRHTGSLQSGPASEWWASIWGCAAGRRRLRRTRATFEDGRHSRLRSAAVSGIACRYELTSGRASRPDVPRSRPIVAMPDTCVSFGWISLCARNSTRIERRDWPSARWLGN